MPVDRRGVFRGVLGAAVAAAARVGAPEIADAVPQVLTVSGEWTEAQVAVLRAIWQQSLSKGTWNLPVVSEVVWHCYRDK
jgi:hypothetical protein